MEKRCVPLGASHDYYKSTTNPFTYSIDNISALYDFCRFNKRRFICRYPYSYTQYDASGDLKVKLNY